MARDRGVVRGHGLPTACPQATRRDRWVWNPGPIQGPVCSGCVETPAYDAVLPASSCIGSLSPPPLPPSRALTPPSPCIPRRKVYKPRGFFNGLLYSIEAFMFAVCILSTVSSMRNIINSWSTFKIFGATVGLH